VSISCLWKIAEPGLGGTIFLVTGTEKVAEVANMTDIKLQRNNCVMYAGDMVGILKLTG
jgi:hypothetical protein